MPIEPPPPVVGSGRVLSYAIVPDDLTFVQRNNLFVNWVPVGRVPCLAIIEQLSDGAMLLVHCDQDWEPCGTAGNATKTVSALKTSAERSYPGLTAHWVDVDFSRENALAYYDEQWPEHRCSRCGRRGCEVEGIWFGASGGVCNYCKGEPPQTGFDPDFNGQSQHEFCFFCGKHALDADQMIESKRAAICGECVRRFNKDLDESKNAD